MSSVKTWRRAALAGIHHRVGIFDGLLIGIRDFQGPDGQVKFPHPWPPQIPPGRTPRL